MKNFSITTVKSAICTFFVLLLYFTGDGPILEDDVYSDVKPKKGIKFTNRTMAYPGRFKRDTYPNVTIVVKYHDNPNALPLERTDCAPGLICQFSDKSWHEKTWDHNVITYINSPKEINKVYITSESPGRFTMNIPDNKRTTTHGGPFAGIALTDLRSDIPITYLTKFYEHEEDLTGIESIKQPVSDEIFIWRILHVASNCDYVYSGRNNWVQALIDRGLVDSFGKCNHNKEWQSVEHLTKNASKSKYVPHGTNIKSILSRKYAFVTAFENSYYPGYITEKLWDQLKVGTLPIYLGAPDVTHLLPEHSFVNVNDYGTYDDLANYIEFLIENKVEYYNYHTWREQEISSYIKETWKFAEEDTNCRICRWGAENLFLDKVTNSSNSRIG